jgi:hypothetical protein
MADNMMTPEHKATNDKYREGYDRIFGDKPLKEDNDNTIHRSDSDNARFLASGISCDGECVGCSGCPIGGY